MNESNVEMLELTENSNQNNDSEIKKLDWSELLTQFGKRNTSIENGLFNIQQKQFKKFN